MKRKSVVVNVAPWEPYSERLRAALVVRQQLLEEEIARLTAKGQTPNRRVRKAIRRFKSEERGLQLMVEAARQQEERRRPELEAFARRVSLADSAWEITHAEPHDAARLFRDQDYI